MTVRRRWPIVAGWVVTFVAAVVLGFWAAVQTTQPPSVGQETPTPSSVAVVNGSVEQDQSYGINVSWAAAPAGVNQLEGTLTSLNVPVGGKLLTAGDVAYTIDLSPVVVVAGTIPAFRALAPGVTGPDVQQLQDYLASAGYLTTRPDGRYGTTTTAAVRTWQKALGVTVTGTVPLGQIVFVRALPNMIGPVSGTTVGQQVGAGTQILVTAAAEPAFSFRVLPEAVAQTKPGLPVTIDVGSTSWRAQVVRLSQATDGTGDTIAVLGPAPDQPTICGSTCGSAVSLGGSTVLPGSLILVPKTAGAQLPTAFILTDVQQRTYVVMANGDRRSVSVLASQDGASIVKGVTVGERVQTSQTGSPKP